MSKKQEYAENERAENHSRVCRDFANRAYDAIKRLTEFDKDGELTDDFLVTYQLAKDATDNSLEFDAYDILSMLTDLCTHLQEQYIEHAEKVRADKKKKKEEESLPTNRSVTTKIVGHKWVDGVQVPIKEEVVVDDDPDDNNWHRLLERGSKYRQPVDKSKQPEVLPFLVRKDRSKK